MYSLPTITRQRSLLSSISGLFLLLLLLAACSNNTSSTASNIPSAQTLISNAQAAIQKVTSYHFNLLVDNPGTGSTLPLKSADGDIQVPDKLQAKGQALILGNVVDVQFISIGSQQYITDPITGKWTTTTGLLDPRTLSDPQTGVAAMLGHIQNPSTPTDSSVGGRSCWNITGKLDAKYFAPLTGGGAPAGTMDDVSTCIGKSDNLPYQIIIIGVAATGDNTNTKRTFTLSNFGETLNIVAPI